MIESERSKAEFLLDFVELQSRAARLTVSSDALKGRGKLAEAEREYQQLCDTLRDYLRVIEQHDRAYPETPFGATGVAGQLVNALLTLADLKESLRRSPGDAEALRDEALRVARQYLPEEDVAERLRQRAASLQAQSRYHEAIVAFTQVRDEFSRRGDSLMVGRIFADIAEIFEWLGDDDRAGREAEAAQRLIAPLLGSSEPSPGDMLPFLLRGDLAGLKEVERRTKLWSIWVKLADLQARTFRRQRRFDESTALYRRIIEQVSSTPWPALEMQIAINVIERGNTEEGLHRLIGLEPAFVGLLRPKLGALLSWQSEALLRLGRPEEALAPASQASADLASYRDADSLWKAQWRLARALAALDRKPEALEVYVQAANTVSMLRHAPLGYRLDSTYLADKRPLFDQAIRLAAQLRNAGTCLELIEAVKSRGLTAVLTAPGVIKEEGGDEQSSRIDELSRQLDRLEYEANRSGWTHEVEAQQRQLLQERAQLIEQRRIADPRWRALTEPPRFDQRVLQETLAGRRQAALSLFDVGDQIIAVVCNGREAQVDAVAVTPALRAAIASYVENLDAEAPANRLFDPANVDGLNAAALVPHDHLELALGEDTLVIAPHGALHLLPWSALRVGATRLFERIPIGVLPNLSCVMALGGPLVRAPRAALLGGPPKEAIPGYPALPLAEPELEIVADLYEGAGGIVNRPFVREDATQTHFFELARDARSEGAVLHMVCHGAFATGDPLNSGLLLTDGRLDAAEIEHSRLPYDEVVLSACSTGRRPTSVDGIPLTGDDVLGLPGAFLEAGVRSVLVSITPARDDAAMRFMLHYHSRRVRGVTPLHALQAAQKAMLADAVEPQLWVGFTAYGCQ